MWVYEKISREVKLVAKNNNRMIVTFVVPMYMAYMSFIGLKS